MSYLTPYYVHKNRLYSSYFPQKWAVEHIEGTGPAECFLCDEYGHWNGVFIGYCYQCAIKCYHGERGRGMVNYGVEKDTESVADYPSIFDTYLRGVDLDSIGDRLIEDTRLKIKEHEADLEFQNKYINSQVNYDDFEEAFQYVSNMYGSYRNGGYDSY
jgi:hypothetical protein